MVCLNAASFAEQITLGQVAVCITFVLGLWAGVHKLNTMLTDWTTKQVKPLLEELRRDNKKELDEVKASVNTDISELRSEIKDLKNQVDRQDMESVKNYLVLFLADIDRGEKPNEIELARFDEEMKYYEKKGGNSYVHRTYERLKAEGKL